VYDAARRHLPAELRQPIGRRFHLAEFQRRISSALAAPPGNSMSLVDGVIGYPRVKFILNREPTCFSHPVSR
jgi:hypothetical protein